MNLDLGAKLSPPCEPYGLALNGPNAGGGARRFEAAAYADGLVYWSSARRQAPGLTPTMRVKTRVRWL
jgi:hypothetical protein